MKWNWGTGIVLAFIAFISFILYFVFVAINDPRANHDMVTEDYYKKELEFQQELDAAANLKAFGGTVAIARSPGGLDIRLPLEMDPAGLEGIVSLYRPSNHKLDFEIPIRPGLSLQTIPSNQLLEGRWDVRISWEYKGKPYLYRTRITY